MQTVVSKRGATIIPARIRKKFDITPQTRLEWIDNGKTISILPVPKSPIKRLRGMFKNGGLLDSLLRYREEERKNA